MTDYIDVIVPRGGKSLVERVQQEARVPVIGHLEGNCHVYVDRDADLDMAREIVLNAKLRRTGVCGAAETVLFDRAASRRTWLPVLQTLLDAGCEVRGDETRAGRRRAGRGRDRAGLVHGVPGRDHRGEGRRRRRRRDRAHRAVRFGAHRIDRHREPATAERFLRGVDSAIVLHNASTQFADGGEFGMGAEIGISTDKFHARGPVGVEQLTSYKYVVRGTGQVRP